MPECWRSWVSVRLAGTVPDAPSWTMARCSMDYRLPVSTPASTTAEAPGATRLVPGPGARTWSIMDYRLDDQTPTPTRRLQHTLALGCVQQRVDDIAVHLAARIRSAWPLLGEAGSATGNLGAALDDYVWTAAVIAFLREEGWPYVQDMRFLRLQRRRRLKHLQRAAARVIDIRSSADKIRW